MTKPAKNTICLWYDGGAEGKSKVIGEYVSVPFNPMDIGVEHQEPRCRR